MSHSKSGLNNIFTHFDVREARCDEANDISATKSMPALHEMPVAVLTCEYVIDTREKRKLPSPAMKRRQTLTDILYENKRCTFIRLLRVTCSLWMTVITDNMTFYAREIYVSLFIFNLRMIICYSISCHFFYIQSIIN